MTTASSDTNNKDKIMSNIQEIGYIADKLYDFSSSLHKNDKVHLFNICVGIEIIGRLLADWIDNNSVKTKMTKDERCKEAVSHVADIYLDMIIHANIDIGSGSGRSNDKDKKAAESPDKVGIF